ncbi:MBL fold metallo-hydrolase [Nonomuraea roseoviolacea]|uniref:Glyoxylase-like metal-dependent hydrolase (Beta-lactamase superfamily II) n=1 Tax=Nonomuraea roseoviolacea subsp. carminata TaxID=160689 RepID=A0ABT1K3Q9_9ACTN|nr:MBL fold metallo-hydrolase [Nonomuraea roseoviolacea]MCP2348297.1 glyoxylase-like metal-dependent hydrolase (beta-lactamase superfamily II) [Nonomuraea roseoviolacea subsp. carminata]
MKIHHLNLGSMREIESTTGLPTAPAVCHALLVETPSAGLVLVEAGLGLDDVARPGELLDTEWVEQVMPALAPAETAARQLPALGFDPADVRHVVLTHLDVDHSGGLPDFPGAAVHVMAAELEAAAAEAPSRRYRPGHWAHGPRWVTYGEGGETWFGMEGARPLEGLDDVLLVPLGGHSRGHAGVAVRDGDRWLLHAGDAYFYHRELEARPVAHPLMDVVQQLAQVDAELRIANQARLRTLAHEHGVDVFSAHDPWELAQRAG